MEEDQRREASIAASPCFRPNFKASGVTEDQLKKFQELRRRRLQIKSKSKSKFKREKDGPRELKEKEVDNKHCSEVNAGQEKDSGDADSKGSDKGTSSSAQADFYDVLKKKPKLHWGLDTRERWERKANM